MGNAIKVYAEMSWRRMRRGRLIWGSLAIILLPGLIALAAAAGGRFGVGLFHESIELYFALLLPLAPVLMASPAVAEEVEYNTHTYLFARPAPRAAIVLGKCLLTALVLLPSFVIGVLVTFLVAVVIAAAMHSGANAADITVSGLLPVMFAVALGVPVYTGVAVGVGTLFVRRPLLGGFLYILVVEMLLGGVLPGAIKVFAVNFHLRAVAGLLGPPESGSLFRIWEPRPDPPVAILVALGIGLAWLMLAVWLVTDAEYRESAK